jgi:tetratricopeptide (TPR) repeat protein
VAKRHPARTSPRAPGPSERREWPWQPVLLAVAAFLAHASSLTGGFVWLDHGDLEQGGVLAQPSGWLGLLTRGYGRTGFYRPIQALTFSVDSLLTGSPWGYHLTNVALHTAASLTVYWLGVRVFELSRRAALGAGLVFALHPIAFFIASALAYRTEALVVIVLGCLMIAHRAGRAGWAAALLVAGAWTKETSLVLGPLFLLLGEWGQPTPRARRARLWGSELAAFALAVGVRSAFAPAWSSSHAALGPGEAVGTRLSLLTASVLRLFAPFDTTICDAFPVRGLSHPMAGVGLLIGLATLALALRLRGPFLYFVVASLPLLQGVPAPRFWSPHYLYLPLAFLSLGLSRMLEARPSWRRPVTFVAVPVLLVFAGICFAQGLRFKNDRTLFEPEVAKNPSCREAHFYLGDFFRNAGELERAAEHYEAALQPLPGVLAYVDGPAALQNLGLVRMQQRRFDEAERALEAALQATAQEPARRKLRHNLAAVHLARGDAAGADTLLGPETERPDAMPESLYLRAKALSALGRDEEAKQLLRRVLGERAPVIP